jgi:arsenate reductase
VQHEGAGEAYTLRSYLDVPPTEPELDALLTMLGMEPWEVCRMKEPIASELGLASLPKERAQWIRVMALHPILIERPILVRGDGRAVIGRSAEARKSGPRRRSRARVSTNVNRRALGDVHPGAQVETSGAPRRGVVADHALDAGAGRLVDRQVTEPRE